jgi:hypothetical protein
MRAFGAFTSRVWKGSAMYDFARFDARVRAHRSAFIQVLDTLCRLRHAA